MPETRPKKNLSVRSKILFTVIVSVLGLSVLVYVISTQVLLKSYVSIEQAGMEQDLNRAVDAIAEFSDQQFIKITDWASWDESYNYIISRDPKWPPTSIYPSSMANLDNNLAMFTDLSGKIFFIMMTDIQSREEVKSDSVKAYFTEHPELVTHADPDSSTKGLVMLPEGPMIIVSLPVKNGEGQGPIHGSLTFGRYLDAKKVGELGKVTHLNLSVYRIDAADLPREVSEAKAHLIAGTEYVVEPLSSKSVSGFALLKDLNGNPSLILRVDAPRPVFAQGNISLALYLGIGAAALLVFGLVIMILLDQLVIARFMRLTSAVEKINDGRDLSIRVQGGVKDEIGMLADKINQMLAWLKEAREAEASSRREIVTLLSDLKTEKEQAEEMAKILKMKG